MVSNSDFVIKIQIKRLSICSLATLQAKDMDIKQIKFVVLKHLQFFQSKPLF